MQSIEEGYPLAMVFPEGGVGYELEASGLMASTDNPEGAKAFLDWTMSDEAIGLYQQYKALITVPGVDASAAGPAPPQSVQSPTVLSCKADLTHSTISL